MTRTIENYAYYGHAAFNKGVPRTANPYNLTSYKGHLWDDGWLAAKLKHSKLKAKKRKLYLNAKFAKNYQKNVKKMLKNVKFLNKESVKK